VLRLTVKGMLNKQIARELGIGEKTVKAHLGRVYERLGVTNRADATAWAIESGLFEADEPDGPNQGS
jgi:DNA-binding NarL/FixJ family response regulator